MTDALDLSHRSGLPDALRVLVETYPRDTWEGHSNFGQLVSFWMQRHMMFRRLTSALRHDAEAYLNRKMEFDSYERRLAQNAGTLLNELHGHHQIEDHHYFPQLIRLDARLERGFELLEQDHEAMDGLLHSMADAANSVLKSGSNATQIDAFSQTLNGFAGLLERHLTDEEEIVVPVILHTGFRG